jgi:hypothetical protein
VISKHNFEAPYFECGSSFEVIPPLDLQYCVPREKPTSRDYLALNYECTVNHHVNAIFWERQDSLIFDSTHFTEHYEGLIARKERLNSEYRLASR